MDGLEKFKRVITRQRLRPRPWDYSYLLLKNNLEVFRRFRDFALERRKTRILDVGCGFKPWLAMFKKDHVEYIGVDFDKELSSADFVAPADRLPFPDSEFDALIYSEVLEHAENMPGVLSEMRRVARPGALVFISSPFVFPEHGIPHDYQRLTRYFYEKTFKDDEIIVLKESNSSLATALASFNLVGEWTPFAAAAGLKQVVYGIFNICGLAGDLAAWLLLKIAGDKHRPQLYGMPL
ncbi:MAG TPA: class I SAM-dependent methyltransferase, partial [Dissulfurispiraceae bacterium]